TSTPCQPARLQWGRASMSAEGSVLPFSTFNLQGTASMGPRFDERGRGDLEELSSDPGALRWGRASVSAEGSTATRLDRFVERLQWGRASMSAEGGWAGCDRPGWRGASMGPRFDERGRRS